jgi:DNA topoisomerase I
MNNLWSLYQMIGGGKPQWTVLQHNGPMFPPLYEPHKVPIIVANKEYILSPEAEEYATMFARFIGTKYMELNKFKNNFWKDFKPLINNLPAQNIDDIDFLQIKKHLDLIKDKKASMTKEEKEAEKKKQALIDEPYTVCIIDGTQQKVGNYKIEPPGIFLGRGTHPKIGRVKKRVRPENVTINLSKDAPIPKPNVEGNWASVIHDQNVIWLASWKEEITGKNKYIFTSLESFFKSKSDEEKFNLAKTLKKKVNQIRASYETQLTDSNIKNKQLATALYFIDNLALRVGTAKDTKESADTVGVTSLRVEHITLMENNTIKLDFLGKDSIRYCKKVSVHSQVYNNLIEFIQAKNRKDELFEKINATMLNEYLSNFMEGLTAKVWRTYNASVTFQKELDKVKEEKVTSIDPNERLNYLIAMFNQANTSVALLCNHQKAATGNIDTFIEKANKRLKELKKKKKRYTEKRDKEKVAIIKAKIESLKLKMETKDKMKNVSLGTSKNNYIDPRIIFAFIKRFEIPPEKLFTQKLIDRFEWASKVDADYRF